MSYRDEELQAAAEHLLDSDLSQLPKPSAGEEEALRARLPAVDPDSPAMVVRSIRWPAELEQQIKAAAAADGVSASEWVRTAVQRVLTGRDEGLVSVTEAIRALERLPHAA